MLYQNIGILYSRMNTHDLPRRNSSNIPAQLLSGHEPVNTRIAGTHNTGRGKSSGSSSGQRSYDASFDIEMARGEGVTTRSGRGRDYRVCFTDVKI